MAHLTPWIDMYHSIIIADELRGYLPLFCRFLSGERGGLRQEKLHLSKEQWIYSLRVNKSTRLLYTLMNIKGGRAVVVVGEVLSHDYHKSRFLRASGALEVYLSKHRENIERVLQHTPENELYEAITESELVAAETVNDEEIAHYYPLKAFGAQLYFQDSAQEASYKQSHASTVIISGASGTGKTVSAMLYLASHAGAIRSDGRPKRFLYTTLKPRLVQEVQEKLKGVLSAEQLASIQFSAFEDLIPKREGSRLIDGSEVYTFIGNWVRRFTKKTMPYNSFGEAKVEEEVIRVIHHEWTLIAGLRELNAYLSLGLDQSYIKDLAIRQEVHKQYVSFNNSLKENEVYIPFYRLPETNERYDGLITDETFLLTFANVSGLCARAEFTMLLCDSHQAVGGHWLSILSSRQLGGVAHIPLRENHRNPHAVIEMLNRILKLKFYMRPGLRDKYEQGHIPTSPVSLQDEVSWIDKTWCKEHESLVNTWKESTQFAVILLCDEERMDDSEIEIKRQQARAIFKTSLILTRKEAQGLEYPYVAVWLDDSIFLLSNELKRGFAAELATQQEPTTRAAEKGVTWKQQKAITLCNQLYVSLSRAQTRLFIYVDDNAMKAKDLLTYLKGETQIPVSALVLEASSKEAWQEEARRHALLGNRSVLREIQNRETRVDVQNETAHRHHHQVALSSGAAAAKSSASIDTSNIVQNHPSLMPPESFNESWKAAVKNFKHPGYLHEDNLNKILKIKNPELINWILFIAEVEEGESDSIFVRFLIANKGWLFIRTIRPYLSKITSLGLNYLSTHKQYLHVSLAYMISLLGWGNETSWVTQLSALALNQVLTTGEEEGRSTLYWLCSTLEGVALLKAHPQLIDKISPIILNQSLPDSAGEDADMSPVIWLCASDEGLELLTQHPRLVDKIDETALNRILSLKAGTNAGKFPAYLLCSQTKGLILLNTHPQLAHKINARSLNLRLHRSIDKNMCTLFHYLTSDEEGLTLLLNNQTLIEKMDEATLNFISPPSAGEDAGKSILLTLCAKEKGLLLLRKHPDLVAKISARALNTCVPFSNKNAGGKSPALFLCASELGRVLLKENPDLAAKLSIEILHLKQPESAGKWAKTSPALFLLNTLDGNDLLKTNAQLAEKVRRSVPGETSRAAQSMFKTSVNETGLDPGQCNQSLVT